MKSFLRLAGSGCSYCCCSPAGVLVLYTPNRRTTRAFLSTLGELRDASFSDKENIVERLSQSGHPSVRAVLTALLEDRLYFRNSDQKIFIVKSARRGFADARSDRSAVR